MKFAFVTGTDTEIGKTKALTLMLKDFSTRQKTAAWKPIAAGCERVSDKLANTRPTLKNEDALALQAAMSIDLPYEQVNPFALEAAIAPHIAAAHENCVLNSGALNRAFATWQSACKQAGAAMGLIEGAGGWLLPLNAQETMADWVEAQQFPVILVVGMRLGCLNHALLSYHNIRERGLTCVGWIANQCQSTPMAEAEANVQFLQQAINAPCVAQIPYFLSNEAEQAWLAANVGFTEHLGW